MLIYQFHNIVVLGIRISKKKIFQCIGAYLVSRKCQEILLTPWFFIRLPTLNLKVVRNFFKNYFVPRMKIEISRYLHQAGLSMPIN